MDTKIAESIAEALRDAEECFVAGLSSAHVKIMIISNQKKIRAVAIIINNNKVLVMHRIKQGREYYLFPGGGVEDNETIEQAVLREVQEETSLEVKIEKLLYHHIYENNNIKQNFYTEKFFYLCRYISGEPKLGDGNESENMKESNDNFYNPTWYEIKNLSRLLLYPLEIRDWFIEDIKINFKNTPKEAKIKISELRQLRGVSPRGHEINPRGKVPAAT